MINRHIKLIQLLLNNAQTYISGNEVSNYLNVSNRTVRNDIKVINATFIDEVIVSVKSRGYHLNLDQYSVSYIEDQLNDWIFKERKLLITIAYKLLMDDHTYTLNELEAQFHLSKNDVLDCVTRLQHWCEKFDVTMVIKRKQGIMIDASASNLSNAILHLNQLTSNEIKVEDLILQELPHAHIQRIHHIIKQHIQEADLQTSDNQVRQLLVHLILIIKRSSSEEVEWEAHPDSLDIARRCIADINQQLGYQLTDETSHLFSFFISYHFNQFDLSFQRLFIQGYIQRLIQLMEDTVDIPFSKDSILKENIYMHFSRTYIRLMRNVYLNNPLTSEIKQLYPFIFNTLYNAIAQLSKDTDIQLSEDEIAFLTIHFQSSIERQMQSTMNVVIVCYYGLGVSTLLAERIKKLSQSISIVDTLKLEDVEHYDFSQIDVLITTHDIDLSNNDLNALPKVVKVSPLFSKDDERTVEHLIQSYRNPTLQRDALSPIQFVVESDIEHTGSTVALSIFKRAQTILDEHQATLDGYIESAMERERQSSTYIGNAIAIPHGNPEKVLKSHVIIFKTIDPIPWKQHNVKLVFFLAIAKKDAQMMKKIIQSIAQLDEHTVDQWCMLDEVALKNKLIARIRE
ncbi:BglG family transcription antiterminator [Staphylococcus caprae]|uniref:BglG family transcription antiterminator n=1 Tax=Staphylococcus caprae TaxID=29380 RepID=UPI0005C84A95|nr:BglG family transcription antiterminator [Staphylococcus caprae]QJE25950.1 BglG family transcription antiterminator [Staphylococcus caprae]